MTAVSMLAAAERPKSWPSLTGKRCQPSLFEPEDLDDDASTRLDLKKLHVERSRRFGDVFLGLALWRSLELDEMFDELLPEGREDVRWSMLAAIHVILRLCSPSSDLAIAEYLYRKTALEDLLRRAGVPTTISVSQWGRGRATRRLDPCARHGSRGTHRHVLSTLATGRF